jgi:N-acetylglucosamine-6-sulfatase
MGKATRSIAAPVAGLMAAALAPSALEAAPPKAASNPGVKRLSRIKGVKPRNIILILTDDHRYDAMGFMGHPLAETPNLDSIARNGVHLRNAFVTTSLCSPSRASILTGQYTHHHGVVDNNHEVSPHLVFFPQYLQRAGYTTAFIGKWHMGHETDEPQRGFDHWVSFKGQGTYLPSANGLNVNGKKVPQKGYITDELTDYAIDFLENRPKDKPFFLELSHKAVHANFVPPDRYKGRFDSKPVPHPPTWGLDADNDGKPMWAKNQRNSVHGVEHPWFSMDGEKNVEDTYRRYCEALLAVDDSVGRVLGYLREQGLEENTVVLYMGDNGFLFGEHGLIDKRNAYEPSIRIPMVMQAPGLIPPGSKVDAMVANVDVAPTLLEAAGLKAPKDMDGISFLPLAKGEKGPRRETFLYQYFWERAYPQTPTCFALRDDRYKYILYHGVWDTDEFFDLQADPHEANNLIRDPAHQQKALAMRQRLYEELERTGGLQIPLAPDPAYMANDRRADGSGAAPFPSYTLRAPAGR